MEVYKELKSLFISNPKEAINKSQQIICSITGFSSFVDFYNYHLEHSNISTCQNEWSNPQMSIHCYDCGLSPGSIICLQCFLDGNHEGHDYLIRPNSRGNCDCGDLSQWKRSGFCHKHHGLENNSHPEDYLDEKLRTCLTDIIFKAAFSSIKHLTKDDGQKLSNIFQFLMLFLKFGDGFRRLLAISLTEKINFLKLFNTIFEASTEFNQHLQRFCGSLINDELFKRNFSKFNYKLMIEKIAPLSFIQLTSKTENPCLNVWNNFWFHCYEKNQVQYNIEKLNWDWVSFVIDGLKHIKELATLVGDDNYTGKTSDVLFSLVDFSSDASNFQPNEKTQELFDRLFDEVLRFGSKKGISESINDTIITTSFKERTEENHFIVLYFFNIAFYRVFHCFISKKNLKFDAMFDVMDKTIDITPIFMIGKNIVETGNQNENDKFVSRFLQQKNLNTDTKLNVTIHDYFYQSFHNGASFFIYHQMYYSFVYLIRNDNLCRVKIAKFLNLEKFQSLRVKLGIITLKSLLSYVCLHQSLVRKLNFGAIELMLHYINNPRFVNFGIPLYFPALQFLIGLQCKDDESRINDFSLKEFFAFEMAREIGLFDDFSKPDYNNEDNIENQKQMIFTFLYLSILLVIERTLFNFNDYKFMEEQIIFGLKQGVTNLNDLQEMFDRIVSRKFRFMHDFNEIISMIATAREKKSKEGTKDDDQDVSFDLKEGVEFKNISAINSFNIEKVIMNNEISKHPNELLKIQNFEPEETYFFHSSDKNDDDDDNDDDVDKSDVKIHLKEFLLTPTVLAFIYHTLNSDSEKVELNEHLAMNILVLTSKFLQEKEEQNEPESTIFDEKTVINYDSKVVNLITQFKSLLYHYKVDGDENATIENTMTKKAFNSFLKLKISKENKQPKSIVDLLLEKGELGKNVLGQLSIEIDGYDSQKEKQDINKMKKIRAHKLKEEIMNHYKSITDNFNVKDDHDDESIQSTSIEKDVCSICSNTKKNEILSYPLYIYRTKFPFIIDKPPTIQMKNIEALKETEVFEDEIKFNKDALNGDENDDNDEEGEQEILDPEVMISYFLSRNPEFSLEGNLDESQIQHRRMVIQLIRQRFYQSYQEAINRRNEKRRAREQKKKLKEEMLKKEELKKIIQKEDPDSIVSKQVVPGNLFVIQFGICQHLAHPDCVNKEIFTCPIDRSLKNGFLPNIDDLSDDVIFCSKDDRKSSISSENMSNELKDALSKFITKYSLFIAPLNDRIVDLFVELIKSLSGLIVTFEVRLRNLPDCLDSKKTKFLSRNLFLTAWYAYRMKGKPMMKSGFENDENSENVELKLTTFQRFVKKLIECDDLEKSVTQKNNSLNQIITDIISSNSFLNEKDLCLFLRRVCLADHFLLKNDISKSGKEEEAKFIDWDEILSAKNLSQKYSVSFKSLDVSNDEDFEFKPFIFSEMPKDYLHFLKEPFKFPIYQTNKIACFNFLDYNRLIQKYDDLKNENDDNDENIDHQGQFFSSDDKDVNSFLHANFSDKSYPTVLLSLGLSASRVLVVYGRMITFLKPFYLDRFRCPDIGFARNQPLHLNEEKYDRIMDDILSGDFTNDLRPF